MQSPRQTSRMRVGCCMQRKGWGGEVEPVESAFWLEREFRLLKGIAEGTYNTKHAEAARLYYTTILLYYDTTTYTHIHLQSFKLGHAHERRCEPNHREQHGVARHEAQYHDGARRGGHYGSQQPERTPGQWCSDAGRSRRRGGGSTPPCEAHRRGP